MTDPTASLGQNGPDGPLRLDRPVKATLCITEKCNLHCRFCYADCGSAGRSELSAEQWRVVLEDLEEAGVICLYIEGGEPLVRPDMMSMVELAAPRFFIMLRTNATLATPPVAARLAQANLGIALVDLWGARAETHDALTGVEGSFQRSLAGIRALLAAGIETQMLLVLTRVNHRELADYLALAHDLGVSTVGILRLYPLGRAKAHWRDLALSLDEMSDAIDGLAPPPGLRIMQSWHPRDANCCWQMAAIDAYGKSIGCAYLREYVAYGNVLDRPFLETWDHPLSRRLRAGVVERRCSECSRTQGSDGGCRSTAYAFHGRFDAPDPFDKTLNRGVDLRELPRRLLQAGGGPETEAGP
jgi:radical SAM protein with 4Fe4S-binding SPASM domain